MTFHVWELVFHFMFEDMSIGNLLVRPDLPLLTFHKELLDPLHVDFSKSSGIAFCQLTDPWGVPVLCTQRILLSSRGQEIG